MGIKARAEYTVSVVNDGKGERTYIRYSDDNGKTFTKEKPFVEETPLFEKADDTVSTNKSKTKPVGADIADIPLAGFTTGSVYTLSLDYKFDEKAEKAEVVIFSAKWENILQFKLDKSTDFSHASFAFTLPDFERDGNYFYARLDNIEAVTEGVDGSVLVRNVRIEKGGVEYPNFIGRNLAKGTLDFSGVWNFAGAGELTTEKYNGLSVLMQDGSWNQRGAVVSCKAGRVYTFSFFAKVDTEIPINCGWVLRNVEDEDYVVTDGLTSYEQFTTEWKWYSVTIKFLKDCPNAAFSVEKKDNGSKMWLCGYKVEYGDKATEYSPAPEDLMFGLTQGKYIGLMSWDKNYPPLATNAYTWSEFKGQDAEMYKLNPLEESAVVDDKGACKITLRYEISYIVGNKSSRYSGDDVTIKTDSRVGELNFTKKPTGEWECVTTMNDFTKKNLGSFNINVMKGQQVLDTRVVPVTYNTNVLFEASQKLGEVVASVRGVSKLIHNMLVGSTFLEPIEDSWFMSGAKVVDDIKYNNSNVVLIEENGATQDMYRAVAFYVDGIVPEKKYTISAMIRTDNPASIDNGAAVELVMIDGGTRIRLLDPHAITPTKDWERIEYTFTAPDRIASKKVEVRFLLWRNGRMFVSQPMMNEGDVAADYTANIKDIQLSLAQIKVTANTISQSITDLSTGIEQAGIHLDGANSEITLKADKTKFVDRDGKTEAFIKNGKLNAKAIDADKVVAEGIQSKTIDAKDATFENVNIKGVLDSVSGTFKVLKCVDKDGKEIATLRFGNQGTLTIEGGDLFMQGMKIDRNLRFYASDIWCRGAFGAAERTVMVVKGSKADCYINGVKKEPITVSFTSLTGSDGRTYYKIPCYSPGYMMGLGTSGFPVDTVLFNISDTDNHFFELDMYETQRCMVINANDDADNIYIYSNGKPVEWKGGEIAEVLQLPLKLTNPEVSMNIVGAGTIIGAFRDNDW